MKTVSILGVTGTIGQNCLKVIEANPQKFQIEAITANKNAKALADAARQTNAKLAAIADEGQYNTLKEYTSDLDIEIAAGEEAITQAAARNSDIVVASIVGAAGLKPTLKAIERGTRLALANKECLVCAGELFMKHVRTYGSEIIPVDSEHSAVFQVLRHSAASQTSEQNPGATRSCSNGYTVQQDDITAITLTASGGPFREYTPQQMATVTPDQAVKHPNWQMGAKISVDSATMMNKGLELIEAQHLFDVEPGKLDIVVHPESVIHGLVAYQDGSVLAQLSKPDMRIPLAYALGWPERITSGVQPINLADIGKLHFEPPDLARFPGLRLAREAMQQGGGAPAILNAANEVAVEAFLTRHINFLDVSRVIEKTLTTVNNCAINTVDELLDVDQQARCKTKEIIETLR